MQIKTKRKGESPVVDKRKGKNEPGIYNISEIAAVLDINLVCA